jgi:hypothetical protein
MKEFNYDFSMFSVQMKPDSWNVMPNMTSRIVTRTEVT